MEEKVHSGLTYGVEDKPDLGTTIVLGFQNVITAFGGLVAVPLIIAGIAGFGVKDTAYMVSAALLASGIVSIIQSKGFGPKWFRVGAGLPTIMGTDFAFVAPAASVIGAGGITAYFGGTMLGALLEVGLSYFVKPLLKFFPPVVTGSVISLMGMTLMSVAMGWAGGGFGSEDFGNPMNIGIAVLVFLVIALINHPVILRILFLVVHDHFPDQSALTFVSADLGQQIAGFLVDGREIERSRRSVCQQCCDEILIDLPGEIQIGKFCFQREGIGFQPIMQRDVHGSAGLRPLRSMDVQVDESRQKILSLSKLVEFFRSAVGGQNRSVISILRLQDAPDHAFCIQTKQAILQRAHFLWGTTCESRPPKHFFKCAVHLNSPLSCILASIISLQTKR